MRAAGINPVGQLPERRICVGLQQRGGIPPFPQPAKLIVLVGDDCSVEVGLGQQPRRFVITKVLRHRERQRALRAPEQAVQREACLPAQRVRTVRLISAHVVAIRGSLAQLVGHRGQLAEGVVTVARSNPRLIGQRNAPAQHVITVGQTRARPADDGRREYHLGLAVQSIINIIGPANERINKIGAVAFGIVGVRGDLLHGLAQCIGHGGAPALRVITQCRHDAQRIDRLHHAPIGVINRRVRGLLGQAEGVGERDHAILRVVAGAGDGPEGIRDRDLVAISIVTVSRRGQRIPGAAGIIAIGTLGEVARGGVVIIGRDHARGINSSHQPTVGGVIEIGEHDAVDVADVEEQPATIVSVRGRKDARVRSD